MNAITLLAMAGAIVTLGDLALAYSARAGQMLFVLLGVGLNVIGILIYAQTLSMESVGVATAVFLGINILAVTAGGILLFGDKISVARILGLLMLTSSMIFIEVIG